MAEICSCSPCKCDPVQGNECSCTPIKDAPEQLDIHSQEFKKSSKITMDENKGKFVTPK